MKNRTILIAAAIFLCDAIAPSAFHLSGQAYADPPPWAPAHGWRAKHHHEEDDNDDHDDQGDQPELVAAPLPLIASYPHVEVSCSDRPIIGTVIGGVAGGLIGNQFGKGKGKTAATISGALIGAVFGNKLGANLSQSDADCMAQALEYAKPGTQVAWQVPQENAAYSMLPVRNYRDDDDRYCRDYETYARVDGKIRESNGTACRTRDGQWQVVQ